MDSVLRQSKAVCPFMKKATASSLRAMTTAARPAASPCGGAISKLQVLAHRCPVMGKAMAVQSARTGGRTSAAPASFVHKAKLHTGRPREAQAVEGVFTGQKGESRSSYVSPCYSMLTLLFSSQPVFLPILP